MKKNRTSMYLYPILQAEGVMTSLLSICKNPVLKGIWLMDNKKAVPNSVVLEFKINGELNTDFRRNERIIDDYPIGDLIYGKGHVVVCSIKEDRYNYFLDGKYSKIAPLSYYNLKGFKNVRDIISKSPKLKEKYENHLKVTLPKDAELDDKITDLTPEILYY